MFLSARPSPGLKTRQDPLFTSQLHSVNICFIAALSRTSTGSCLCIVSHFGLDQLWDAPVLYLLRAPAARVGRLCPVSGLPEHWTQHVSGRSRWDWTSWVPVPPWPPLLRWLWPPLPGLLTAKAPRSDLHCPHSSPCCLSNALLFRSACASHLPPHVCGLCSAAACYLCCGPFLTCLQRLLLRGAAGGARSGCVGWHLGVLSPLSFPGPQPIAPAAPALAAPRPRLRPPHAAVPATKPSAREPVPLSPWLCLMSLVRGFSAGDAPLPPALPTPAGSPAPSGDTHIVSWSPVRSRAAPSVCSAHGALPAQEGPACLLLILRPSECPWTQLREKTSVPGVPSSRREALCAGLRLTQQLESQARPPPAAHSAPLPGP